VIPWIGKDVIAERSIFDLFTTSTTCTRGTRTRQRVRLKVPCRQHRHSRIVG
jgi:hypothetical protein